MASIGTSDWRNASISKRPRSAAISKELSMINPMAIWVGADSPGRSRWWPQNHPHHPPQGAASSAILPASPAHPFMGPHPPPAITPTPLQGKPPGMPPTLSSTREEPSSAEWRNQLHACLGEIVNASFTNALLPITAPAILGSVGDHPGTHRTQSEREPTIPRNPFPEEEMVMGASRFRSSALRHAAPWQAINECIHNNQSNPDRFRPPPSRSVGVPPTTPRESKPSSCLHPSKSGLETRGNPIGRRPHPGLRIHLTRPAGSEKQPMRK
jgi:hypothetical protein